MKNHHTLYIQRIRGQKNGVLTLQYAEDGLAYKAFDKLKIATGQTGYNDGGPDDWVTSKGGTPEGDWFLRLKKQPLQMEPKGTPFYVMESNPGTGVLIGPEGKRRTAVGLHLENQYPGTAGCTALLWDTPQRKKLAYMLFDYLDWLSADLKHIPVRVRFK